MAVEGVGYSEEIWMEKRMVFFIWTEDGDYV